MVQPQVCHKPASTMTKNMDGVQIVRLLWRDFIRVKIPQCNANKSASRLYVYAPKVK
jgi:hypothetical protein